MAARTLDNIASINAQRNLFLSQNAIVNAVRRTNVKSRVEFQSIIREITTVTPQDLGNAAARVSIQSNSGKSPQDRFFDMFA